MYDIIPIINQIIQEVDPSLEHNENIEQINRLFRKAGFYTTKEYPIFRMKDGSGRAGRIDLVARKGKFRVVLEYDHHKLIKWKSFQKIVQIKPEVGIAITGSGDLKTNLERAAKYKSKIKSPLYVVSLKERGYELFSSYAGSGGSFKN